MTAAKRPARPAAKRATAKPEEQVASTEDDATVSPAQADDSPEESGSGPADGDSPAVQGDQPDEQRADEQADDEQDEDSDEHGALEPSPVEIPVHDMPVVTQPKAPIGLPTGNPWDLAYPLGYGPPTLHRTGGDATVDGPGYVGEQVDDTPNDSYTVAGVTAQTKEQ